MMTWLIGLLITNKSVIILSYRKVIFLFLQLLSIVLILIPLPSLNKQTQNDPQFMDYHPKYYYTIFFKYFPF